MRPENKDKNRRKPERLALSLSLCLFGEYSLTHYFHFSFQADCGLLKEYLDEMMWFGAVGVGRGGGISRNWMYLRPLYSLGLKSER